MDIQPQAQQPISDDQELAKVLAGVSNQADEVAIVADESANASGLNFEETGAAPAAEATDEAVAPAEPAPAEEPAFGVPVATPGLPSDLDAIKTEALTELRPLVDKLNVSPEEKFDTYLLLLRSTDDRDLVAPAHAAAQAITDETKKAQALLDIIKEIDYLSNPQQPQA